MKTSFVSTILVLLPFFVQVPALAVPEPLFVRGFGGGRGRGGRGGAGGRAGAGTNPTSIADSAVTTTSVATTKSVATTSAASTAAAATATSTSANSTAGAGNTGNPQTSLTLDPAVISTGFENNGQDVPTAGQVASLTSGNNFINFCLTAADLPLTNGKQITTGSCNTAPMGIIPASSNMPSAKFTNPKNGDTIAANTAFTISMAISNLDAGNFVNAEENYFSAPQQLSAQGLIIGHSHVVVEQLTALDQTTPTDPTKFAFFKGLNSPAVNGILTADVTDGLPAGFYKVSSINTAANHQPCLVPIAQHGSLDDVSYFTVSAGGSAATNATTPAAAGTSTAAASTGAAVGKAITTASSKATTTASGKATTTASGKATTTASSKATTTVSTKATATTSSVAPSGAKKG